MNSVMINKHTPGPWRRGTGFYTGKNLAVVSGIRIIATVLGTGYPIGTGNSPQSDADANLITAAPDLLEALKAVYEYWLNGDNIDFVMENYVKTAIKNAEEGYTGGEHDSL